MECTVMNLNIHYEEFGSGRPVLILHGYTVDHRLMTGCLEPVFQHLNGYRRIYVDLPGMGKTKSAPWIHNSDVMLEILCAFIDQVIPGERFLLAGESYGGYLARGVVYRMASRVSGLFLLCPAIITDSKKRKLPRHIVIKRDEGLLGEIDQAEVQEFERMNVVQTKAVWERYRDEILTGVSLADMPFLKWFQENGYAFSFVVDCMEAPYHGPALFLMGRQDTSVGYRDAWEILENYPRAAFAVLDRAGHNLQIEQAGLHDALVKEWLNRVLEAEDQ